MLAPLDCQGTTGTTCSLHRRGLAPGLKRALGGALVVSAVLGCTGCAVRDRFVANGFFDSNGVRIRYRVCGQGPTVVLLHGFGETMQRWDRAEVRQPLSREFRVVDIDMRAHGESDKPRDRRLYGAELTADVVRLLSHLQLGRAHVVGYSIGGHVALDLAGTNPERVSSVVLVGAGWSGEAIRDHFDRLAVDVEAGRMRLPLGSDAPALAAFLRGVRVLDDQDVRGIQVPIAAVIGANDAFMADVLRLAAVQTNTRVVVIPGATHSTTVEHPSFVQELFTVLRRHVGTSAKPGEVTV
jgi:pimeloyl-ACP methyl ester carboxylesterase